MFLLNKKCLSVKVSKNAVKSTFSLEVKLMFFIKCLDKVLVLLIEDVVDDDDEQKMLTTVIFSIQSTVVVEIEIYKS